MPIVLPRSVDRMLKATSASIADVCGLLELVRRRHRSAAVILTYHGVLTDGEESYANRYSVERAQFADQLAWLTAHYEVLALSRLLDGLEGRGLLPAFSAALTFDDGHLNNLRTVAPLLEQHGLPATFFIVTAHADGDARQLWTDHVDSLIFGTTRRSVLLTLPNLSRRVFLGTTIAKQRACHSIRRALRGVSPRTRAACIASLEQQLDSPTPVARGDRHAFLGWDEVRQLARRGWEIGSHTHSHAILATLNEDELRDELQRSKRLIEENVGRPCTLFSFPNGGPADFTPRDQRVLRETGYRAAVTQIGFVNDPGVDLFALRRVNISRSPSVSYFKAEMTGTIAALQTLTRHVGRLSGIDRRNAH